MKSDKLEIEILADGTIKFTTDKISSPNHANCEMFLREVSRLAGGVTTRQRRPDAKHQHEHSHVEHEHN